MPHDKKNSISRAQAVTKVLKTINPLQAIACLPPDSTGLIAATDTTAQCDVPEADCSVRDGFAICASDVAQAAPMNPVHMKVSQRVHAETLTPHPLHSGQTARILTGGIVPDGADSVIAEEDVEMDGDEIIVRAPVRTGWFVRRAGGEIAMNSIIARSGTEVTPQAAAVMTRTRVECVMAHPSPKAWVMALGSELSDSSCCGEECNAARFPADNLVLCRGLLERSGCATLKTEVVPDNLNRLTDILSWKSLPDIIITTGGTGSSERDYARLGAQKSGFTQLVDTVNIRPGRNMFAARRDNTLLFGLPGPPAAVFACFHAVVLPAIQRLRGLKGQTPVKACFSEGLSAKPGAEWLVQCTLSLKGSRIAAKPLTSKNVPPMLGLGMAHGLAVIPGGGSILPGEEAEILTIPDALKWVKAEESA